MRVALLLGLLMACGGGKKTPAGPVAVPVEDGHAAARLDQATDRRLTQAAGAAGDQC